MRDITKLRLLYLYKFLVDNSSEQHPVTKRDMMNMLMDEHDLPVNRVTLINDIKMLKEAGVPIRVIRTRKSNYYYEGRAVIGEDLNILADVVASSSLLAKRQKQVLIGKLEKLAAPYETFEKKRNVVTPTTDIIPVMDAINDAINRKLRISFQYTEYVMQKDRVQRRKGKSFVVSPYSLVWEEGICHVVCLHEGELKRFRLDRIYRTPEITEESIDPMPEEADEEQRTEVTLLCGNRVLDALIDRFGTDAKVSPSGEEKFEAVVSTAADPAFYGWVFQWAGDVKILGPAAVAGEYRQMCEKSGAQHG